MTKGLTKLCVAISVQTMEQALADAALAAENGADLVEYRVDLMTELESVASLVRRSPLPCIVTCRPTWEGGLCELPDQERIPVLEAASLAGASYIDVELVAYRRSANLRQKVHFNAGAPVDRSAPRPDRKGLIVSSHDFQSRPARLSSLVAEMNGTGADVVKVAWAARSVRDNLEAFELLRHRGKPTIALCMGEAGLMSRVLAPKFGGFLTFAALRPGTGTAPGQPSLHELLETYRFRSIGPGTSVYGVVGSPVAHSLSPHVHNAAFAARGIDSVYLPLPVQSGYEAFKAFMETVGREAALDLRGLSVTLPHKENAYRYLKEVGGVLDAVAEHAKAVNTIHLTPEGLRGTSTDHAAILHCIRLGLVRDDLREVEIAVLGAGGTGRTTVAALVGTGARVHVYNRTLDRAEQLAEEFPEVVAGVHALSELLTTSCRVFVQTTSVGMAGQESGRSVWEEAGGVPSSLGVGAVAFDTVYTPLRTAFLRVAGERGAVTVPGVEMFAHQAAAQFRYWTGLEHPLAAFREKAEEVLVYRGLA